MNRTGFRVARAVMLDRVLSLVVLLTITLLVVMWSWDAWNYVGMVLGWHGMQSFFGWLDYREALPYRNVE